MKISEIDLAAPDRAAQPVAPVVVATAQSLPEHPQALARARAFAEPLLSCETLDTGENTLAHADAVAVILKASVARRPCKPPATWCTPVTI